MIGAPRQPAPAVDLAGRIGELLRAEAFTQPRTNLRLIETHISWVILAGVYAYKIRKPVSFGFLGFSSLDNRQADCEAEIRLNQRLCPGPGRLGLVHVSSDLARKRMIGIRPTAHRLEGFERGLYSRAMSRRTYAMLRRTAAHWLRRRQSVVLDATYGQPAERAALRQLARRTAHAS